MLQYLCYSPELTPLVEQLIGRRCRNRWSDPFWLRDEFQLQGVRQFIRIRDNQLQWMDGNEDDALRFTPASNCPIVHPVAMRPVSTGGCKVICTDGSEWLVLFEDGLSEYVKSLDAYNLLRRKGDPGLYLVPGIPSYLTLFG